MSTDSNNNCMKVFVLNMRGQPLMPCSPRKARILLKQGKAKIVGYNPFTIQLNYPTGETKQDIIVGIDEGSKYIGFAIVSQNKVLAKGEIELRQNVSDLIKTRTMYRRNRRQRKTRYRTPRFLNRKKPEDWLPPSISSKLEANFRWIDKICSLIPNPKLRIEVGKFDIAKMINPEISGVDYQLGQTYGYYDVRYFVFARDEYTCQVCYQKNKILQTHHIVYRSMGGTDKPDNLITVCTDCHTNENHRQGGILYKWAMENKKIPQYKEPPFMNILRIRTYQRYPNAEITYGSETSVKRKELGLEKTHYNDAIAITGINEIKENVNEVYHIRQFRKKKRSLHEATPRKGRKVPNIAQKRNNKNTKQLNGWHLNDQVIYNNQISWITGFSGKYGCYIIGIDGKHITHSTASNKEEPKIALSQLRKIRCNNNWQFYFT